VIDTVGGAALYLRQKERWFKFPIHAIALRTLFDAMSDITAANQAKDNPTRRERRAVRTSRSEFLG
jgi:hypothetical protein